MLNFDAVRRLVRKNRTWISFRRAQTEGLLNAFRRYRLWTEILRTDPVKTDAPGAAQPVEIHLLCYWRDYL
ncbi:MAG TPA: hypothetical protein VKG25_06415, partial [Bryobacteraceae bacterium]|nr:hypothetical protein [Bryobacteraceae bacterium]